MSILSEIKRHEKYSGVWLDSKQIMRSLGIDLDKGEFVDLSVLTHDQLYDLLMKSLMWMETINETLSTSKKLRLDKELETDRIINQILRSLDAKKVSEAKAEAKSHPSYISASKDFNLLYSYVDYLERILTNIDKYHYAIKSKIEQTRNIERKY